MDQPRRFDVEPPRRVLIVGNRGAGKRSLAKLLSDRFHLATFALDRKRGALSDRAREEVGLWARGSDWVITTDDTECMALAVSRAEWLVWIDLPVSTCALRVLLQRLRFRRARKQGKATGDLPTSRLRDVFAYPTDLAPRIMHMIDRERRSRTIYILRSRSEVAAFVKRLPGAGRIDDHLKPGRSDA